MIGANNKRSAPQVRFEMLNCPYESQHLTASGTVLSLRFGEHTTGICNYTPVILLGEYCANSIQACISIHGELCLEVRIGEYWRRGQMGLESNEPHLHTALSTATPYLRSSMTQERLNNVMLLHCHKNKTESLDMSAITKEFVSK